MTAQVCSRASSRARPELRGTAASARSRRSCGSCRCARSRSATACPGPGGRAGRRDPSRAGKPRAGPRAAGSASMLNCGLARDRGNERTSRSRSTPASRNRPMSSSIVRVEWPIARIGRSGTAPASDVPPVSRSPAARRERAPQVGDGELQRRAALVAAVAQQRAVGAGPQLVKVPYASNIRPPQASFNPFSNCSHQSGLSRTSVIARRKSASMEGKHRAKPCRRSRLSR